MRSFVSLLNSDINERLSAIENVLNQGSKGQEAVKAAADVIDSWQNLARDLMLLQYDLADLIQHQPFEKELAAVKSKLNLKALINLLKVLKQARQYLAANVNPRLALESVAVSF